MCVLLNVTADEYTKRGFDIDGEASGDAFGSVSLSHDGSVLAIGARNNDGNGTDSGHVCVYSWNVGLAKYTQRGINIDGENPDDLSGHAVSISNDGSVLAIGAHRNDGNGIYSGHVRVYSWDVGLADIKESSLELF